MFKFFDLQVTDGVCVLTYDRPPVNAVSYEAWEIFAQVLDHVEKAADIITLVLTSPPASRAWFGGGDLKEFLALDSNSRREKHKLAIEGQARIAALSKPTIAAITSHAIGGGMVIAALCDIRVAADSAEFGMPEVDRGLAGGGGSWFYRLNMPAGIVREMIFTGRRLSAAEAERAGFLNYILPKESVREKALEIARMIAGKSLPALQAAKRAANIANGDDWLKARIASEESNAVLVANEDFKEALNAFFEKRKPVFRHR
jgi:enoyl-CoA hydratase/carnithine racemase